jgi:hypothetical protein
VERQPQDFHVCPQRVGHLDKLPSSVELEDQYVKSRSKIIIPFHNNKLISQFYPCRKLG